MKKVPVNKVPKVIRDRVEKTCAVCGKKMNIILYTDRSYRGGYYFFKIPVSSKAEWAKSIKAGTKTEMIGNIKVQVLKKDPKPHSHVELWECAGCYRGAKK